MRGLLRAAFGGAVAGLLLTGPQAGAGGGVIMCFSYEHVPFQGAPSSFSFGAFLPGFEPGTELDVTIAFGDFEGSAPRTVDEDRILFGKVPIAEFGEYRVRVTTIEPPDEVVYGGSIVVEPGPFEGEPCSRGRLRELAAAVQEPEPEPDLAPGEEPPVGSPPVESSGEFPWVWVIAGGGAGGAAGAALLISSRKKVAAEGVTEAAEGRVLEDVGEGEVPPETSSRLETTAVPRIPTAVPRTPTAVPRTSAAGPSVWGEPVLQVTLVADPPGSVEDPADRGDELTLRATVANIGTEEARDLRLTFLRLDHREGGEEINARSLATSLPPGQSVEAEVKGKTATGEPVVPGVTRMTFAATAEAANADPARIEDVSVHVGHPVLLVSLGTDAAGSVPEGTEVRYQVRVQNVGRAEAKDVKGRLTAQSSSPDRKGRDSWERSFEADDLGSGRTHEEEFVIVPSALGDVATLRATASVEADGVVPAESDPVELTINRL